MRVGVPKEIKVQEYRVGLTPGAVREYVAAGHEVHGRDRRRRRHRRDRRGLPQGRRAIAATRRRDLRQRPT